MAKKNKLAAEAALTALGIPERPAAKGITRFVRFRRKSGRPAWGVLKNGAVQRIKGDPFGRLDLAGDPIPIQKIELLAPAEPRKIFAVGLNYKSHLGDRPAPTRPEIFYKPATCLQDPAGPIRIPETSQNLHYEGELVLVIGKSASRVSHDQAAQAIFGVTCGNDVSERDWQRGPDKDVQWWRAKGCDTFGPCGPVLVRGLDYSKLQLRTRLNGETVQEQSTGDLLFDPASIVSEISRFVTLDAGDLIFTGTPGSTRKMSPGDLVEVEIEGIGVLRNPVA
jgi:2-keto-4-pentenoate hydratase/2-oxohepta-3-ene-1,7-dioic acid hydratase in catechol pathway